MSCKRTHDEIECEPIAKRKLDDIQLLASDGKQLLIKASVADDDIMDCEAFGANANAEPNDVMGAQTNDNTSGIDNEEDDDYDTDPDFIIPYLHRFQESYQSSLSIYSSRLDKLELSDALKCTNELFTVAIDNYEKEHQTFVHKTRVDMSGVYNVRREFDCLLVGTRGRSGGKLASSDGDGVADQTATVATACLDEKLAKVIAFMCQIENKICADMKQIYVAYEKLLEDLVMIEYRLAIIIEMFHHMTDIDPQKFLPSLPFIQNVPDLIGYINSLYDEQNELNMREESSNERMQAIVNQFQAMHKRIRDAMDGLHALSCIIMEKKTEVIDRVHTFYKKAEQIFFSQPSFVFQTRDNSSRCL